MLLLLILSRQACAQDVHVRVDPRHEDRAPYAAEFSTIQMALDHAPAPGAGGRLFLHIAPGVYRQRVWVSQLRKNTTFLGAGHTPGDVIITASASAQTAGGTFFSETVEINGDGFQADNITFENAAGPVGQALAVSVNADRVIFKHCRFLGDQDTLFANDGRQFYLDDYIQGGVDFIFGNAAAVFAGGEVHVLRQGYLTAQSRTSPDQPTGFIFDHVRVTAEDLQGKSFFLGRPWRQYARVVFLKSQLPATLSAAGWAPWPSNTPDASTPFFAEFDCSGAGAQASQRVAWSHRLTASQAREFTAARFLAGHDHWDPERAAAGLP